MTAWLKLTTAPPRGFYAGPEPSGLPALSHRRLLSVGPYRRPLLGETSNQTATLDNSDGDLTAIFAGLQPLLSGAEIRTDAGLLFAGVVDQIDMGAEITIRIVAGLAIPETQPPALRSSTAWTDYPAVYTLPHVYGRVSLHPRALDDSGRRWLLADHAIEAVESVTGDGVGSWDWRNTRDEHGRPIAVLDTFDSIDDGEKITVTVRGKLHPTLGGLITNPAAVLWDILANINGATVTENDVDGFRLACQRRGLIVAGVLDGRHGSTREAIREILESVGGVYSAGLPGLARLWPVSARDTDEPVWYGFDAVTIEGEPEASAAGSEIYTVARVQHSYSEARGDYTGSLTMRAPAAVERYGERVLDLSLRWCGSARQAAAVGERLLQWYTRPRWGVSWSAVGE